MSAVKLPASRQTSTTVGDVCDEFGGEVQTGPFGSQLHSSDYCEDGIPVVMPQDMQDGRVTTARIARVGAAHVARLRQHCLRKGDIVFSRRGDVARFAVIAEREGGWLCGTGSIRIRLNCPGIEVGYLRWFLSQPSIGAWLEHNAKGVTMPNLNTAIIRALPLAYPSLPEQRRIAAILDQADALRAKRREALAELDSLTQSIFIEMFGTASDDQLSWPTVTLAEAAEVLTGYAFKSDEFVGPGSSTVRLCRGTNVMPGRIDWQDLACWPIEGIEALSSFALQGGDIVLAMDRPWISEGFKIARISLSDCPALLVQRVARVRARANAVNDFLYGILMQPEFAQHCRPTETTIPHISPKEIRSFEMRLPPLALQKVFATRVQAIESLKATHRAALDESDALFAALQHSAFAGQLS